MTPRFAPALLSFAMLALGATAAQADCADGLPALKGTGLCQEAALALIPPERLTEQPYDIEGCSYAISETMTPADGEAIIYRALSCNGKTTALEFSAGAKSASLGYGVSGFFDQVPLAGEEGWDIVQMFSLDGVADPKAMILDMARQTTEDPAEAAACEITPAGDWLPPGALLVDVNMGYQEASKIGAFDPETEGPDAGVYAACGPYGITDASDFWLLRHGYAWFVRQGQDVADFDAGTLTVIRRDAAGAWKAVP